MNSATLPLRVDPVTSLEEGTLVLAFSGWMDGGDVSTGTVQRLVDLLESPLVGQIDPELFYIYNIPGSMDIAALFRPHVEIEGGLIRTFEMPQSRFFLHREANLALFIGKEPNLHWKTYGDCIFEFARQAGIRRLLFVGSFGGSVPHTRQPRMFVTCSDRKLLEAMRAFASPPATTPVRGRFLPT